jgi:hypothetical protein
MAGVEIRKDRSDRIAASLPTRGGIYAMYLSSPVGSIDAMQIWTC